ncbi:hypothetical protein K461DRAFT_26912 [Myriangium duriaei CBS 260.36]|uniref:Uncharacterized protein n=1 Tax=Myriangium duriaei CBS 260.36 TaxID=1168546 RepID=A0A9P4JF90_9PEZI|nr:hypothetical protein K461DRAFT_26912 [Myriangium duriaei CBS 260.36]
MKYSSRRSARASALLIATRVTGRLALLTASTILNDYIAASLFSQQSYRLCGNVVNNVAGHLPCLMVTQPATRSLGRPAILIAAAQVMCAHAGALRSCIRVRVCLSNSRFTHTCA